MRRTASIVFALALVSGIAWLVVDRSANDKRDEPAPPPGPVAREMPVADESESPVSAQREALTSDIEISEMPADLEEWEVVEYGEFVHVREYRRNCETMRHYLGAGDGEDVTTCERKFEIDHAYALFTDEQLAQIAKTDGEAAYILAHRQLFPAEPGAAQDIEAGVNNALNAMIRGAEGQALDLILDESVMSPHRDMRSFFLWTMVGEQLGIASAEQVDRMLIFRDRTALTDVDSIEQKAAEIAGLIRDQRLIVLGTEF